MLQWNRNQWILGNTLTICSRISKLLDLSPNLFSFPVERRSFFFHSNKLEPLKQKSCVSYMTISSKNVENEIAGKCETLINTHTICLKARTMFLAGKDGVAFLSHLEPSTPPCSSSPPQSFKILISCLKRTLKKVFSLAPVIESQSSSMISKRASLPILGASCGCQPSECTSSNYG